MKAENTEHTVPLRSEVASEHRWSLHKLFANEDDWETAYREWEKRVPEVEAFKGSLGQSAVHLCKALDHFIETERLGERLGYYAHLRVSEDQGDSAAQGRMARYTNLATRLSAAASYMTPEIQAIPDPVIEEYLADGNLEPYRIYLRKLLRYKPHILSEPEERLLAMQAEFAQTPRKGFGALTDVDMDFGYIETPEGRRPLTQSSYGVFLQHPDRDLRRRAYTQFMAEFDAHKNTLAALYNGSVQRDIYLARVRRFPSSIEASLFADNVPVSVYDRLLESVHEARPVLHRYYDLRRRVLNLDELRLYDVHVPLVPDIHTRHTYEEAVELILEALAPLGEEYTSVLREGLYGTWVDRYENKGKRSGAFSAGPYDGDPHILMNYKEDLLRDVFTLMHEAGHSMHAWYSSKHQAYQDFHAPIFTAEVASTFNEQLLYRHMERNEQDPKMKAYLLSRQLDDLLATLFRQTLFAEFEKITHEMAERNEPLTVDSLRAVYRKLQEQYFGPGVTLEEESDLEGLRIPHFYSSFYVYQYATGISAAIALEQRVLAGGAEELDGYLAFLKSGDRKFPIDLLRDAGVDMTSPEPVQTALHEFESRVSKLEQMLT